ncbi:unnamed protein product [Darwinula stevensoni]|uniref:C1q domain-containing protein n=1 Tax=Darwinula stevensoni TaxID=69355 RepID=A0A7R8XEU3_9CRUS|nr:unnamed protein product [Darwinula stevensoni]CAG0896084.1 unnamed protein product [Darwinula stevensoni]
METKYRESSSMRVTPSVFVFVLSTFTKCTFGENILLNSVLHLRTVMELEKMVATVVEKNQELAGDIARIKHDMNVLRLRNKNLKLDYENLEHDIKNIKSQFQEYLNRSDKTKLENVRERLEYLEAITKQITPRTCEALANLGITKTGTYLVDPDGSLFGDPPIQVLCDMGTGQSKIHYCSARFYGKDLDNHCTEPGCYSRKVAYNASMEQITALINQSATCLQQISVEELVHESPSRQQYDCISAALNFGDTPYAWWLDRNGQPQYYWDGANAGKHLCHCGLSGYCINRKLPCNCDAVAPESENNSGTITNSTALPITELRFGGLYFQGQKADYKLGGLVCRGHAPSLENQGKSCLSLRLAGNTRMSFLINRIEGRIDVVPCRMELEVTDTDFQVGTGVHIAEHGIYFDAYRTTPISTTGFICFDGTEVNFGNAMEPNSGIFTAPLDGIYEFHFHYSSQSMTIGVELRRNGRTQGILYTSGEDTKMPGQSILLDLKKGDKVYAYLEEGNLAKSEGRHAHFLGYLLYPV